MIGRRAFIKAGVGTAILPVRPVAAEPARLLLLDEGIAGDDLAQVPGLAGSPALRLERELVRQWRKDLRARFLRGERGLALLRWDKALLLAGLAREDQLPVRQRRLGRSLFAIEIG